MKYKRKFGFWCDTRRNFHDGRNGCRWIDKAKTQTCAWTRKFGCYEKIPSTVAGQCFHHSYRAYVYKPVRRNSRVMFRYAEGRSLTARVSVFVGVSVGTHRVILERFVLYHVRECAESRMERWFDAETSRTARATPPTTGLHTAGFWFPLRRNPVDRIVSVTFRCFQTQIELHQKQCKCYRIACTSCKRLAGRVRNTVGTTDVVDRAVMRWSSRPYSRVSCGCWRSCRWTRPGSGSSWVGIDLVPTWTWCWSCSEDRAAWWPAGERATGPAARGPRRWPRTPRTSARTATIARPSGTWSRPASPALPTTTTQPVEKKRRLLGGRTG